MTKPVYYEKGAGDSLWRRADGDHHLPPNEILGPNGWELRPPMDPKAWLTDTMRLDAEEARAAAKELGFPIDGIN